MKSKEVKGGSNTVRYVLAAILGGLGVYFLFGFINEGGSFHSAHMSTCKGILSSDLNLVEVYKGDGSLDLRMYVFSQDAISKEVMTHSVKKVNAFTKLEGGLQAVDHWLTSPPVHDMLKTVQEGAPFISWRRLLCISILFEKLAITVSAVL
jgi:hypothetical protein